MFAILDTDLRYTFVNNGFANIMGVKADYFDSKFHFDLFPNKMLQALFENVLKSGEEIMVKAQPIGGFLPKDDKKYWNWEIKALKSEKSIIGVSLTIIDVTSEIQALNFFFGLFQ